MCLLSTTLSAAVNEQLQLLFPLPLQLLTTWPDILKQTCHPDLRFREIVVFMKDCMISWQVWNRREDRSPPPPPPPRAPKTLHESARASR